MPSSAPGGGPAALAADLRLLISALPTPVAFKQPLLLPAQPAQPTPCDEGRSCGYLVALEPAWPPYGYPPPYEEQFNAQRLALMELLYMARATGRVLVEPLR